MTDSVGQKIARKLNENCCLQHLRPESESMLGIAALIDAELARERDAWMSVKERLPELTEKDWIGNPQRRVFFVLAKHPEHVFEGTFSINTLPVFWPIGGNGYGVEEVTHWMPRPLPAPPACGS